MAKETIRVFVARNSDDTLRLFRNRPIREHGGWVPPRMMGSLPIPDCKKFEHLKHTDEPLELELNLETFVEAPHSGDITDFHIEELIRQARRAGDAGLTICSSGNISWRVGDYALVSGTGSWIPELANENVSICRVADGEVVNGVKPSMESVFHLGIMRERPDVNVVLHFQSKYATLLACTKDRPQNINVTAEMPLHVGRVIPVIPFMLPGSPELAKAVVEAMKNRNSIQLAKHGQVVCGKDFNDVFQRAMFFEMGCRIVYQALQAGKEPDVFTEEELDEIEMHFLGHTTKDGLF